MQGLWESMSMPLPLITELRMLDKFICVCVQASCKLLLWRQLLPYFPDFVNRAWLKRYNWLISLLPLAAFHVNPRSKQLCCSYFFMLYSRWILSSRIKFTSIMMALHQISVFHAELNWTLFQIAPAWGPGFVELSRFNTRCLKQCNWPIEQVCGGYFTSFQHYL